MKNEHGGLFLLGGLLALLLFLLFDKKSGILQGQVTTKFIPPDPATGVAQFDPGMLDPSQILGTALPPVLVGESYTCPEGSTVMRNRLSGEYVCVLNKTAGVTGFRGA